MDRLPFLFFSCDSSNFSQTLQQVHDEDFLRYRIWVLNFFSEARAHFEDARNSEEMNEDHVMDLEDCLSSFLVRLRVSRGSPLSKYYKLEIINFRQITFLNCLAYTSFLVFSNTFLKEICLSSHGNHLHEVKWIL